MTSEEQKVEGIASSIATGQSGAFFEQHVGATFLGLLLVRATPPILLDCQVTQVSFQTERLGWATDDLLILAENATGQTRKLVCQVKRKFTVSSNDEDCKTTIKNFWHDFTGAQFNQNQDRLCLVTLFGTNSLLIYFNSLLECASAAQTLEDFENRIGKKGFISAAAKNYLSEIRNILQSDGAIISPEQLWNFLRSISVVSFDLNSRTSQTEAWIKSLLALSTHGSDKTGAATSTWNALLEMVSKGMPQAKLIDRGAIPEEISSKHSFVSTQTTNAIGLLNGHTRTILNGIHNSVGGVVTLDRENLLTDVLEKIVTDRIVVISGNAGSGKSSLARTAIEHFANRYFCLAFRSEEFAKPHLDEVVGNISADLTSDTLASVLSGQDQKIILIESGERLLESSVREAFGDLVNLLGKDCSWKLVITCRSYSLDIFSASFLSQIAMPFSTFQVGPLSDDELTEVAGKIEKLKLPLSKPRMRELLRNPYVLDKASRMPWSDKEKLPENERGFRQKFWSEIVRADDKPGGGMPQKRETALTEVSLRRAKALTLFAKAEDLDQEALEKLRQSDLIVSHQSVKSLSAPAHDLLEDWTLLNWLEAQSVYNENDPQKMADTIGGYPALRRAYRLWLTEKSELDSKSIDAFVQATIRDQNIQQQFRDDTIVSLLKSAQGADFLIRVLPTFLCLDRV